MRATLFASVGFSLCGLRRCRVRRLGGVDCAEDSVRYNKPPDRCDTRMASAASFAIIQRPQLTLKPSSAN
jgi:hypothetical protein